jgi:type IV pilus assembly protein PilE
VEADPVKRGYSLLDLLTALAIAAIFLTLAVPTYQKYTVRAHRAEAVRMLLMAADCEQQLLLQFGLYDTTRCLEGLQNQYYRFSMEPPSETASTVYTIRAEPVSKTPGDPCGTLSLDQAGTRFITGEPASLAACWGGR